MKTAALALLLCLSVLAQLSIAPAPLTNSAVEAMIKMGTPTAVIVQAVMNARAVDFLVNTYEFNQLTATGASNLAADQILDAMHQRMIRPAAPVTVEPASQWPQPVVPQYPPSQPMPKYQPASYSIDIRAPQPDTGGERNNSGTTETPQNVEPRPMLPPAAQAPQTPAVHAGRTIFVDPKDGFESYVSAALFKKHVPIAVVADAGQADYVLLSAPVKTKEESGLGKLARCAYAYCIGINGSQTASIQLLDVKRNEIIWAYSVRKGGSSNYQSSAEAIAKHLKEFLSKTP